MLAFDLRTPLAETVSETEMVGTQVFKVVYAGSVVLLESSRLEGLYSTQDSIRILSMGSEGFIDLVLRPRVSVWSLLSLGITYMC